jgi:MFS family permease
VTDRGAARPLSNPWVVLATLLTIYIFNFADRYLITGLVGPIKAEFGVDDGFMGLMMGPAFVTFYVVAGVPIARMADRGSRVKIIAAGCVIWSACTIATGFATGPLSLALARVGVGVGEAAFVAPAYSLLADYFRPEKRGLAFAILGLATYAGQIAGQAGGPAIAAAYSWHSAFFFMGAPGIALGLLALLLIREPPRRVEADGTAAIQPPFLEMVRELARAPAYLLMMAAFALAAVSGVAFGYWGPELFSRAYAIDPVAAKSAFAINFGLAGLGGMLAYGALADRLSRRDKVWPVKLSAIAILLATCAILSATWTDDFATAKALAIPSGVLGGGWSVGFFTMLQLMLPDRYRAAATALFIMMTTLFGYFVAPWLVGAISEALGNNVHSLRIGLSTVIPFGFAAALCAWLSARHILRDAERLAHAQPKA